MFGTFKMCFHKNRVVASDVSLSFGRNPQIHLRVFREDVQQYLRYLFYLFLSRSHLLEHHTPGIKPLAAPGCKKKIKKKFKKGFRL